jgi:hypothetical protein
MEVGLSDTRRARPRKVPVLVQKDRRRLTPRSRRLRLNRLIRGLAFDLGFDLASVTLAERNTLHQAATMMLQAEITQAALVGGASVDPDTVIRLSSEARRLLAGLRAQVPAPKDVPRPMGPLFERIARELEPELKAEPSTVPEVIE